MTFGSRSTNLQFVIDYPTELLNDEPLSRKRDFFSTTSETRGKNAGDAKMAWEWTRARADWFVEMDCIAPRHTLTFATPSVCLNIVASLYGTTINDGKPLAVRYCN